MRIRDYGWAALAAGLALGVLSLGAASSSAGGERNFEVIKEYLYVDLQPGVWDTKVHKPGQVENKCNKNADEGCALIVYFDGGMVYCPSALGAGDVACREGTEQPLEYILNGTHYRCDPGSTVWTNANMVFIPDTCWKDDVD